MPRSLMPFLTSYALILCSVCHGQQPWKAKDLNPVTIRPAPQHATIKLVENGQPKATIVVMNEAAGADHLQSFIKQATGAELPIVQDKVARPAIVLGDCPESAAIGLESRKMPPEGFAIKTTPDAVFIVGNRMGRNADGQLWGVFEFLERFVGVRWYFPPAVEKGPQIGQSIPRTRNLVVPPVWLEDAPVFRKREIWPPVSDSWRGRGIRLGPLHTFLRHGNSWPNVLRVHQPNWRRHEKLIKDRPEVFQMRKDGSRQHEVLCYGNPKTLQTYLEGIQNHIDGKKPAYAPISDNSITVSPADVELACYCEDCRKLWDDQGGQYGGASKVMATFVDKLAGEVRRRWPREDFTVVYLPYLNYTKAPQGFRFPGNVEVQLAGMPGLATYKEPAIRNAEQANIDRWVAITGRPIQNWHYSCWPGGRFSPKGIYEASFPPDKVEKMKALLTKARDQAEGDPLAAARVAYVAPSLEEFFEEAELMGGQGFRPLLAQKVGEMPAIDGKLTDSQWKRAPANPFVRAAGNDKGKPPKYPTTVQAVWTFEGITFGFQMREPTPHLLETGNGGHDNGTIWWDDNVELFLDVTGKNEGEFYQFIVNSDINIWDSKLKDTTWECKGFKAAAHRGKDFWSLEVYLPYSAFPEASKPGSGTDTVWTGNFTRHRIADKGLESKKPQQEGSTREYQRMNTAGSTNSANLADFAELRFIE